MAGVHPSTFQSSVYSTKLAIKIVRALSKSYTASLSAKDHLGQPNNSCASMAFNVQQHKKWAAVWNSTASSHHADALCCALTRSSVIFSWLRRAFFIGRHEFETKRATLHCGSPREPLTLSSTWVSRGPPFCRCEYNASHDRRRSGLALFPMLWCMLEFGSSSYLRTGMATN